MAATTTAARVKKALANCRGACAEVLSAVLPARSAKPEIQRLVSTEENVAPA
jgi:hypothetical protein